MKKLQFFRSDALGTAALCLPGLRVPQGLHLFRRFLHTPADPFPGPAKQRPGQLCFHIGRKVLRFRLHANRLPNGRQHQMGQPAAIQRWRD